MSDQKIQQLIDTGYEFTAWNYIAEAWSIFRKQAGSFIGFFLVFIFISVFVSLIPFVGTVANSLVVSPLAAAGFYIAANKVQRGQEVTFSDFFKGVDYLAPLVLMSLILSGIYLLLFGPSLISLYRSGVIDWYRELLANPFGGMGEIPPFTWKNGLVMGLNFLPLLYLQVAYMWAPLFIIFYGKEAWSGLETSRQLITKRWFSVFRLALAWIGIFLLFALAMGLAAGLGAVISPILSAFLIFGMVIAVMLALPVVFISYYTSFASVTDLLREEEGGQSDVLDHLVD